MFRNGNVEGDVNEEVCNEAGIKVLPGLDRPVEESLTWTTNQIVDILTP